MKVKNNVIEFIKHYYIEPAKTKGFWICYIIVMSIMYWVARGL
ncbi:hypothetical protein [Bacillus mycoides]|nr:hypothetical protein [Bacillus mycoides]MDM5430886.1 hypothetical protein [Bacillus mycoides]